MLHLPSANKARGRSQLIDLSVLFRKVRHGTERERPRVLDAITLTVLGDTS